MLYDRGRLGALAAYYTCSTTVMSSLRAFASIAAGALFACGHAVQTGPAPNRPQVAVEESSDEPEPAVPRAVAQIGHNLDVWAMAWSPTGTRIATGGFEHTIRIWNTQGRLLATLLGHREALTDLAFSSRGDVLASAARDGSVRLWDLHHAGQHRVLEKAGDHVAFEPGGKRVASVGYDLHVRIWDAESGKLERELSAPTGRQLRAVAWSADGARIAAASLDGPLFVWANGKQQPVGQAPGCIGGLASIDFSPDGQSVACAGYGVVVVALPSFRSRRLSLPSWEPINVRFSPDGQLLATDGTTGKVHLWDAASGKYVRAIAHPGYVSALAWAPKDTAHAGALGVGGKVPLRSPDGSLVELPIARVWDAASGKQLFHLEGVARPVTHAEWDRAGDRLLTISGEVALWDARTGARQRVFGPGAAVAATLNPKRDLVAIASREAVRVVDITTGKEIGTIRGRELAPRWSPDGSALVAHSFESVQLFDVDKRRARRLQFPSRRTLAFDAEFSADSRELALAQNDRIELFDVDTGKPSRSIALAGLAPSYANPELLSFGPGGQLAATLNGAGLLVWDGRGGFVGSLPDRTRFAVPEWSPDGRLLAYSVGHDILTWSVGGQARDRYPAHDDIIRSIAFSPDGRQFASSSDDSTVRLWRVGDPRPVRSYKTHEGRVWSVAWHPSGNALVAVGNDAQLHHVRDGRTLRMIVVPGSDAAVWYTDSGQYVGDERAAQGLLLRSSDDLLDPALDGGGASLTRKPQLLAELLR